MIAVIIESMPPALSQVDLQVDQIDQVDLNQRDMSKQLLTPLRLIARMNFSLKNYSRELLNFTGTVGKVSNSFQLLQQLFAKAEM